jgi:TRAP transporter TAXI family solute receptor
MNNMTNFPARRSLYIAILAVVGIVAVLVLSRLPAGNSANYNLTVAGASPGGLWSALGVGLDKAVNKSNSDFTITYQTSSGGLANAKLVSDNKVPLGIASDIELQSAWEGTGVFQDRPLKNLRVLFRLFTADSRFQSIHLLLNRDFADKHGIETFADIVANKIEIRVAVNRPGNMDGDLGIAILAALGAPIDEIRNWGGQVFRAATREQTNLMTDRRLDLINFGLSYNHASVRELANAVPLVMIDLTEPVAAKVVSDMGGKPCTFRKDEYEFLDHDVTTICTGAVLIANQAMDEELAYMLTKAMLENLESFKSAHQQLAQVTTLHGVAEDSVAPRHPGAERALREAGLIE